MGQASRFRFLRRPFPSANQVLVTGPTPVLIDTGFGSDATETLRLVEFQGVTPGSLAAILNTHHHSDHVGGNYALAHATDAPICGHPLEARLVNRARPQGMPGRMARSTGRAVPDRPAPLGGRPGRSRRSPSSR